MQTADRLLPVKEALPRLGIGLTKFHELLNQKHIQAIKVGSRTMVSEGEILRFRASLPKLGRQDVPGHAA